MQSRAANAGGWEGGHRLIVAEATLLPTMLPNGPNRVGFNAVDVLALASLGHVIGIGIVLGLKGTGALRGAGCSSRCKGKAALPAAQGMLLSARLPSRSPSVQSQATSEHPLTPREDNLLPSLCSVCVLLAAL